MKKKNNENYLGGGSGAPANSPFSTEDLSLVWELLDEKRREQAGEARESESEFSEEDLTLIEDILEETRQQLNQRDDQVPVAFSEDDLELVSEVLEQKRAAKRTAKKQKKTNREILFVTYVFSAVFVAFMGYFIWFINVKSPTIINNSYNSARLDLLSNRVQRGTIMDRNGIVIAESKINGEGTEIRNYPYANAFAHVVGYSTRGKTALESKANFYLLSTHENILEQLTNELSGKKKNGDNLVTTLEIDMQLAAYNAMGDYKGAALAMDVSDGGILAMVSKADYDPNQINEIWDSLVSEENTDSNLLNRAMQGVYPPGSTFKILTLLAYMRENPNTYQDYTYECAGHITEGEYTVNCYDNKAHGLVGIKEAFSVSCNCAFINMALSLKDGSLMDTCNSLLFNTDLPSPLGYKESSFVMNDNSNVWAVMQTAMGQGETLITPYFNLLLAAAIANEGVLQTPYLMDYTINPAGDVIEEFETETYGTLMSKSEAAVLKEYMGSVVTDGTGKLLRSDSYTAYGKTGSAEYNSTDETHSLFMGFATNGEKTIAVSIVLESAGSGGDTAASVARAMFDEYFSE